MTLDQRERPARPLTVDPVDLELIRTGLQAVSDLVKDDLTRTAFSPIVYEYKDFAVGVVDTDGRLISMGVDGIPMLFLGVVRETIRDGVLAYGLDDMHEGDVFVSNYVGTVGQHLNNVVMYMPVAGEDGAPCAFVVVAFHWLDVGGIAPGSGSSTDTELAQEGLHLRSIRLYDRGREVPEIFRIIALNTRLPEMLLGDISAQYAGCRRGLGLFRRLLDRYGQDLLFAAIELLWTKSETAARAAIAAMPDGTYTYGSYLDDDGVERGRNVPVTVTVVIDGDVFRVDYSGLGRQGRGPFNSGRNGGAPAVSYLALMILLGGEVWMTEGLLRPVEIDLPDGTFLSADDAAARAFFQTPLPTVLETLLAAVAPVLPERVMAGSHASFGAYWFAGTDAATGKSFQVMDSALGGWGATADADGISPFRTVLHVDSRDIPIETAEALAPIRFRGYRWRRDSEGAGEHRGGSGVEKEIEVLADCVFSSGFERSQCAPWGLHGGEAASPGHVEITRADGSREVALKSPALSLHAGDVVRIRSGGGGGFGPACRRDEAAVLADVRTGAVSRRRAEEAYGVAIDDDGRIDRARTDARRAAMRPAAKEETP